MCDKLVTTLASTPLISPTQCVVLGAPIGAGPPWPGLQGGEGGTLSMWVFLSARLRMWLLLVIALPLARLLVHRLAVAAERHDPSTRTAKLLRRADSAVTAVSGRFSCRARR